MKVSELIKELQTMKDKHGNLVIELNVDELSSREIHVDDCNVHLGIINIGW